MKYFEQRNRLAKIAKKRNLQECRETLAGAYVMRNKQVICTGYAGAMYNEIYDGIEQAKDGEHFDMETILISYKDDALKHPVNFKYSQTWEAYTEHRKIDRDKIALIDLDGIYVDFQVFMPVYESLGHAKVYISKLNEHGIVYISGDAGEGIVCPYRILNKDKESEFSRIIIKFELEEK